ncbi:MAG: bifunctional precorrin-2 dehydrogenase/sirohydrochlorin ferrochelatase [Candidatus Methanomethylophilaceae archaeon]|nr:bifunctional precorrin-2 dehydrogenase/sirohydrochlorin ferrochelatase [Candidatus Methanomethylophilaceae archaeon]NLF33947.1 bifunctional precorrin-2 dehydrogenase/sirohydrochlorin ferrochelatase [Thermoplasmatales archaeon]
MTEPLMAPVFLSTGERLIVVFGGGRVALRKCLHFKGFRIKAVAADILPEIEDLASETVRERVDTTRIGEHISGAFLVIAATDSRELNDAVRDLCLSEGVPVNSAHGGGDILIPSVLRRGKYAVAVSTEGRAPAFPPYVIRAIDGMLDGGYDLMLDLIMDIRPAVMEGIPSQPDRAAFLASVLDDPEVWGLLREGHPDAARDAALRKGGLR